jgi:hypothetical protein
MENERKRIQVDSRNIHYLREMCPLVCIIGVQLPQEKMSTIFGYTLTVDLPFPNTFSQNGNN